MGRPSVILIGTNGFSFVFNSLSSSEHTPTTGGPRDSSGFHVVKLDYVAFFRSQNTWVPYI